MSVIERTPQDIRLNNLLRISRLTIALGIVAGTLYVYLGFISQNWYNYLVAGSLLQVSIVAALILHYSKRERPIIGAWHLITSWSMVALIVSAIQANAGSEVATTILVTNLVIILQAIHPDRVMRGVILSVLISMACSVLAFYSPFPQAGNALEGQILGWVARGSTLALLVLILMQFRSLTLASKLLISFLGVVVLISMTFNFIMSTTTTDTLTNQIGQDLYAVAESRSTLIGNLLSGHAENLTTLTLDDSIQDAIRTANKTYSGNEANDLNKILAIDDQWRTAVVNNEHTFVVDWPLNNEVARDLKNYQSLYPDNIETFTTDKKGALIGATNLTSDYYQADEVWWQTAYNNGQGKVYISLPIYDESAGAFSILIAVPVFDQQEGEIIGILRTTLSLDKLFATVQEVGTFGETGEVDIIFPAKPPMRLRHNIFEEADPTFLASLDELTTQSFARGTYQDVPSIYAKAEINTLANIPEVNELGWIAVAHQDSREALEPVQRLVRTTGLFGTIMAGIASLLSVLVAQRLANPIINLTNITNEVARGNLDARSHVETQDEIGQLSNAFNDMTSKLKETLFGLETRVAERTAELEASSLLLQKRAEQFEAIAQMAGTITSIQDIKTLLPRIAQLVNQLFGFYHVGLFLLDESRQYAVLSASNSEGGQMMLARKHRLGVGQTGIVGHVTSTGNPRIALDTGADAVYFDNPDLPETRSEMALPLRVGRTIIGALDVQSTEPNAFSEEDVEVLSILADEVSVAIENARLFEESQRVLADAQSVFGEFTLVAWQKMITKRNLVGYELSGASIRSLQEPIQYNGSSIAIPIKLRDRVIGAMNIALPENKKLDADETDIAQALAQRIGIAIESATLLEESRRRAIRESMVSEISAKLSATAEVERLMQVAVSELRQALGASEVILQLSKDGSEY